MTSAPHLVGSRLMDRPGHQAEMRPNAGRCGLHQGARLHAVGIVLTQRLLLLHPWFWPLAASRERHIERLVRRHCWLNELPHNWVFTTRVRHLLVDLGQNAHVPGNAVRTSHDFNVTLVLDPSDSEVSTVGTFAGFLTTGPRGLPLSREYHPLLVPGDDVQSKFRMRCSAHPTAAYCCGLSVAQDFYSPLGADSLDFAGQ